MAVYLLLEKNVGELSAAQREPARNRAGRRCDRLLRILNDLLDLPWS